jgi:hypothetical protein
MRYKHVYAIVRLDQFLPEDSDLESRVAVKKIVWTVEEAQAEVDRLNKLNGPKGARYFWRTTRLAVDERAES